MVFDKRSLVFILSPGIGKINNQTNFLLAELSYQYFDNTVPGYAYLNKQAYIQLIINISKKFIKNE